MALKIKEYFSRKPFLHHKHNQPYYALLNDHQQNKSCLNVFQMGYLSYLELKIIFYINFTVNTNKKFVLFVY